MVQKHIPTDQELANDPSLKWACYRKWEAVWSDSHNTVVRFCRYEECGNIRVAGLNTIGELPELVHPLNIRRVQI